jgi:hypothetical protein
MHLTASAAHANDANTQNCANIAVIYKRLRLSQRCSDCNHLHYDTVQPGRWVPKFQPLRWTKHVPPNDWYPPTGLQLSFMKQKIIIWNSCMFEM